MPDSLRPSREENEIEPEKRAIEKIRMLTDAERVELEKHAKYLANVRTVSTSAMKEQSDGMSRFREGVVVVETEKLISSAGRKLDMAGEG